MRLILIILLFSLSVTGNSQTKYDTINLNGINYCVFKGDFMWDNYKTPPDSLPDGHWICFYPNKNVAFTAEYRNGRPYDTLKRYREYYYATKSKRNNKSRDTIKNINKRDSVDELFVFRDGRIHYYISKLWGVNDRPEYRLEERHFYNEIDDSIIQLVYDKKNRLENKRTFIMLKNIYTDNTFFTITENGGEVIKKRTACGYNSKGKLICNEVTNYNGEDYNTTIDCYNNKGKLIRKDVTNISNSIGTSTIDLYNNKGKLVCKNVKNYKREGCTSTTDFYNYKGKFKYKRVTNYVYNKVNRISDDNCYDREGTLIKCPKEKKQ